MPTSPTISALLRNNRHVKVYPRVLCLENLFKISQASFLIEGTKHKNTNPLEILCSLKINNNIICISLLQIENITFILG